MIEIEVRYKQRVKILTVYNEWDIDEKEIVGVEATKADAGKYFKFDDGSGWYSKIVGVTPLAIRTEICIVRKDDYVHQAKVQYPQTSYSGAFKTEEHELVRPFNKPERRCVYRLMHDQPIKYLTKRIKMLTLKGLQAKLEDKGIDEEFIINLLINSASKGNEKVKSISILARIGGIELEPNNTPNHPKALFVQNNLTIQDQRRNRTAELPSTTLLKEMIAQTKDKIDEVVETVPFQKEL
jgi:hypothetical protein